ncbi:MAG TPA: AraC family transcriptional regulator ligand-binding domain-containing protein, partial [Verrucomicrobiae bacterium]|nr:AraC family transcriptional regulator ligand-binding domain-containing protein [Verrucomicrobiae bacterium]
MHKDKLLSKTGLSPASLDNPSNRIPIASVYELWENVMRLSQDRMIGVSLAEKVPFGSYSILDYMLATSDSPRDALMRSCRSFSLMNNALLLSLRSYRDVVYLELHNSDKQSGILRPYVEYIFTNYLMRLRMVTRMQCNPSEVHVTYAMPAHTCAYDRLFRAPVRFNQPVNRLIFPRDLMEIPHPFADPEICELLESYAREKLRVRSSGRESLSNIREVLSHRLENGDVSLTALSRHLGKSQRSLQREVSASGTTFREILDSVRHERAITLLKHDGLP